VPGWQERDDRKDRVIQVERLRAQHDVEPRRLTRVAKDAIDEPLHVARFGVHAE